MSSHEGGEAEDGRRPPGGKEGERTVSLEEAICTSEAGKKDETDLVPIVSEANSTFGKKEHGSRESSNVKSVLDLSSGEVGEICEGLDPESSGG